MKGDTAPAGDLTPNDDGEGRWRTSLLVPTAIIVVAIGIIGGIVLIAQQQQDEGGTVLAGTTVDPATLPATLPYREVAGSIIIDVSLGERGQTVPMILDTGAPTIVTPNVAEVFASGTAGTIGTSSADGQVFTSDVVSLPQLTIGSAVFGEVGAVIGEIEPGNPFYCLTDTGFVGANLMQTAVWQIDPIARTVTIAAVADDLEHVDGATRLDLVRASEISPSPLIELPAGEGVLTFLLDTGSDGWLAVHPEDLDEVELSVAVDAPSMAILGTSAAGPFVAQARWVAAADEPDALPIAALEILPAGQGNAGLDYLSRFVVTLDWPGGAVYLDPVAEIVPAAPPSAGLAWDDGYVVGSYVEGLPANAGLELGAEVTAIDGVDVRHAPFDDLCTRMIGDVETHEMTVAGEDPTAVGVAPVADFFEPLG